MRLTWKRTWIRPDRTCEVTWRTPGIALRKAVVSPMGPGARANVGSLSMSRPGRSRIEKDDESLGIGK